MRRCCVLYPLIDLIYDVNDKHKAAVGGCTIPIADNTILSLTVAKKNFQGSLI